MSETQTYIERLRALRADLFKAMDGLDARGLNWKPTRRDTNSAFVLATHLVGSERHWIHRTVGGRAMTRDRDAEFRARGKDTQELRETFAALARESEAILAPLSAADLDAPRETPNYGKVSARWVVVHMIEHYAEHVGHVALTRQVWEDRSAKGTKSARKPRKGNAKETKGARKTRKGAKRK